MDDGLAIKVEHVSKSFKLPHEKLSSVKGILVNFLRRKKGYEMQHALENVSFEIKKGEFFGIVGRNGSGKSTLLKMLAGIYTPNKGTIRINGKLTPFIELGVGFNPELTGRENVFLNGALLGFNRKEVEAMYNDIVAFAELERFMDQKLKNYSSGMQVRLAFSIAIQSKSDIYLFDEVLAVGDYAFQQKCLEHFKYLKSIGKTVILVSHDANSLQMFCTSGILLEKGSIIARGKIKDVLAAYTRINTDLMAQAKDSTASNRPKKTTEESERVTLRRVYTEKNGKACDVFGPNDQITVVYEVTSHTSEPDPVFGLVIQDASGRPLFATNTLDSGQKTNALRAGKLTVRFQLQNVFNDGRLYISGAVANADRTEVLVRFQNAHSFRSVGWTTTAKGAVYIPYEFAQN